MPPLVSQFGRQRANINAGGMPITCRDDYDPRLQSKTKRPAGTTGSTYQTRTGTRVQNLQPAKSKQQLTRRPFAPQRRTITSNIFQLATALQAAKGTVGTPRREAKSVGDRPTYQVSKFIDRRTATRRQEPSDSYSDYYSYYSDSYPSDYFDDLVTSRSLSQRGASGSKDTSFAMLDDLIELIKENSISSQHSRDSRDNQSTRSKTNGKKSSSTSAFKQPSRASQSNSRSTSKSDQKAHKKAFSLADSQQEGSEHEFDSVIHQSLSTSQNSINTEIVIPNTKVSRGSMNFIEHNRMMAVHPYNAANSSKKDSILNSGQEKRTSYMENGLTGSTTGFINESRRHQQIRRKQAQDTNSNEDNSNRRHRTTGTPDLSIITGSAGSLAAPLISSAIATSGGADLSIDAGSHAVMSSVAPLVPENKELQVNYSEAQSHNNLTDKPARRYMLLKDSEKYRLTVQQQQQQHMIQPKVQQPVLSHSALLTSGGPAEAPSEKVNVNTSGLSVRATPNSSALVMPHQLPGETPLPKYITTANDAFNLFRDKYRNLKQEKKALEKELAELKATLETERSELIAARQQIRHLESTKAEMRNEFRAILDEKEKIIYQLNTTVDQAHRIAIDRSLLDRSSADGGDIKLSAQPPVDTEAIYREAYEQAKIELLRELRQDLSVELEHQRAKRRGKEGDIELALSNLVTNKQCSENAIVGIKEPAKPIVSRVSNESSDIDYLKKGKKPTLATRSECTQEHNSLDSEKKDEVDKSSEEAVPSRSPLITIPISTPITSKSTASTTKAVKDLTAQALVVSERDQSAQSGESSPMTLSPDIYKDPLRGISLHSKPPPPRDGNTQNELQEEAHKLVVVDNEINSVDGSNAVTTVVALQKETISTEANVVCTLENLQLKEFARIPDATVSEESVLPEEKETKSVTSVPRLPSEQSLNNHLLDEEIHNIEDTKEDKPEGQWNSTLEPQLESNAHAKADCALDEKQGDNIYYMQIQTHTKLLEHEEFAPNDHIDQEQDTGACEDRLSEVNTEELTDLTPAMTLPSNDRAKLINVEKLEVKDWEGDEAKGEDHNELPHHMNVDSHVNVDTKSAGVTESIDVLDASTLMSGVVPDISEILADHTIQNLSMLPTPSGVSFMPRTEEHTGSEVALRDDGSAYMELTAAIDNIIDDSYYGNFIVIFMNMSEYPEGGEALCQLGVNMANCIYANASIELNAISQFEPLSKELLELVHDQHSVLWSMSYYTAKVLLAYFCAFGTDTLELITAIAPDFAVVLTEVSPDMGEGFANECHVLGALLSLIASLGVLCTEGDLASFIQASQTLLNLMKIDDCPIYLYPIPVIIVICIEVLLTNGYFLPLEADDDTKDEASILQENVTEVVATTLVKLCKKYLNQVQAGDSDEFLPEQHELCNIACLMQSTILLQREVRLKPELLENVQAVFEGVAQSTRALASVPGLSQYYEVVSSSKS